MAVKRNYRINLRNYGNPPAVMVSQYDENYDLVFEVYDGVVPATGLNAYTVKLVGRQPGEDPALKYEFTGTVSGIANNILSFTIDTTMTGRAGKGTAEIVILDTTNDVKFASFNLPVYVEKAAVPDDAIDADVERAQEIADEVQDIVDTAAATVKGEAEAWAVGQRDGVDVPSTDPAYENNAKYYAEQAAQAAEDISGVTDQVATNTSDISDLKEDLIAELLNGNAFDLLPMCDKISWTHRGVTFAWSGNKCTVSGTSETTSVDTIFHDVNAFPAGMQAGGTYRLKYSAEKVRFQILVNKNGTYDSVLVSAINDAVFTIPNDASGVTIRLCIYSEAGAISETVEPKLFTSTLTNSELQLALSDFMSKTAYKKGVIPNGTDFNTFLSPGIWGITSSYTFENNPLPSGYGGTLLCFECYNGMVLQIVVDATTNSSMYVRTSIGGNWRYPWTKINGGTSYENTYVTEYYENSYNIECTPTITTDTNNYLASTGDTTDRTGDIQTMLNTTGVCRLGPGVFYVTGVEIPNYGSLIGSGKKTQIILASSVTNGYAVKLRTYSTVKDVCILGSVNTITPSSTVGTRHGIVFEGTADAQSSPQTFYRSYITGCLIRNFAGGGITCRNTGPAISASLVVSDCQIATCDAGVNVAYYSEFHRWTNVMAQECYYGCICNGGNNNFVNCDFSQNKTALLIDNSTNQSRNNTHGTFSACTFHHSNNTYSGGAITSVGTAIKILGASAGEIFSGCQIGYGNLEIDNSIGIRFDACNFLKMTALKVTNSPLVVFSDCNFWDANSSPLTQSGNTTLKFHDCYLDNGAAFDPAA